MSTHKPSPKRRNPLLIPLSHDHHNGLARARDIVLAIDGVVPRDLHELAAESHAFAHAELLPHFEREEAYLMPPFIAKVGDQDTDVQTFMAEHQQLRALTEALQTPGDDVQARLTAWSQALTAHIRFEERTLFGRVQEALSEAELATLGAHLAEDGGPACRL